MKNSSIAVLAVILCFNLSQAQIWIGGIEETLANSTRVEEFTKFSPGDLWLLRNFFFAKHGYKFRNEELNFFFSSEMNFELNKGD